MTGFNLCGKIIAVGDKRSERAPHPYLIECADGRDKTAVVPVDIFGEPGVGEWYALSGALTSREYQGRRYLQLEVRCRSRIDAVGSHGNNGGYQPPQRRGVDPDAGYAPRSGNVGVPHNPDAGIAPADDIPF